MPSTLAPAHHPLMDRVAARAVVMKEGARAERGKKAVMGKAALGGGGGQWLPARRVLPPAALMVRAGHWSVL